MKEKAVSFKNEEEKNHEIINENKKKSFKDNKKYSTLGIFKEKNAEENDKKEMMKYPYMETIESLASITFEENKEFKNLNNNVFDQNKIELFRGKSAFFLLKNK